MSANIKTKKVISLPKALFGTDGVRGRAGRFPITPDIILKLGQALGFVLSKNTLKRETAQVVIGKDTRLSGYMLEQALASGLNSMGVRVHLVGPMPTPGVGFLTENMRADAGIMISASHNPYYDNGIKIFGSDGYKISDTMENEIEDLVLNGDLNAHLSINENIGRTRRIDDAIGRYIVFVKNVFPIDLTLEGLRIVVDGAHGAAYKLAPMIFEELGAEVITLGNSPNGLNVNMKSGALHAENLSEAVQTYRADLGIALDGDADRLIMCDEKGQVLNGDHILALSAIYMKSQKKLNKNTLVATHMSNLGLDQLMHQHGIKVLRADVGDKNVIEEMIKGGYSLGGEQSGHLIFLDHCTTGDGILASLKVLETMLSQDKPLSELGGQMQDLPQILKNVNVLRKPPLSEIEAYPQLLKACQDKLGEDGRIYIRYSGTEPKLRILVEGENVKTITHISNDLGRFLQDKLN